MYRSDYAGTNKATAVTWTVDNVKEEVADLKSKGVVFEHYDMPGMTRDGDVYVSGDMKVGVVRGSGWQHPERRGSVNRAV